jgi:hypothetical protein
MVTKDGPKALSGRIHNDALFATCVGFFVSDVMHIAKDNKYNNSIHIANQNGKVATSDP